MSGLPSPDFLKSVLDYDPATGILTWKAPASNRVKVGDVAGVVATNGRRYLHVGGDKFMAHRIVWAMHYGVWPSGDVKQKNGNYDDLRIDNLVDQTRQETARNRRVNENSKSGHAGVTRDNKRGCWQVHYTHNYKQVFLGLFDDLDAAVAARKEAETTVRFDLPEAERSSAAHRIARRRRQRMAWKKANAFGPTSWNDIEDFCRDIGDVPETKMDLVPIDASKAVGPGNFRWSLPIEVKHDFRTRDGLIAYRKAHREANPNVYRERELRKRFGIGLEEYNQMLVAQNGVCAICAGNSVVMRNGKEIAFAVDHDHNTQKIRSLLCTECNIGLGKMRDDPQILRNAIKYLEKHNAEVAPVPDFVTNSPHRDWLVVASLGFGA